MPIPDPTVLLLALIVGLAATVQISAGFGSTIVALTLGSHLMPLDQLLPTLIVISLLTTFWMIGRDARSIDMRLLCVRILPLMGVGTATGIWVSYHLHGELMQRVFGALVVVLSIWELGAGLRSSEAPRRLGRPAELGFFTGAGVVHGIYGTGGPLLVYAMGRLGLDKATFRGTISSVWCVMNGVLIASFVANDRLGVDSLLHFWPLGAALIPAVIIGEKVHGALAPERFRSWVYGVLLFAGFALLL